jgi:hypothetical protein
VQGLLLEGLWGKLHLIGNFQVEHIEPLLGVIAHIKIWVIKMVISGYGGFVYVALIIVNHDIQ